MSEREASSFYQMAEDPNILVGVPQPVDQFSTASSDHSIVSFQNQVVTMKLDRRNYIVWKYQIMKILY